jgi:hypothetical protein
MTATADADNPDAKFTITLDYSWQSHLGDDRRQSHAQADAEHRVGQEALMYEEMLTAFEAAAAPVAAECKRNRSSFQPSGRFRKHHFDGGIDITHTAEVIAACAGAVPLSLVIKAARDVLVKWLGKRSYGIRVKLGGGREIEVRNVPELNAVLTRLEQSEFAKAAPKPAAKATEGKPKKATAKSAGAKSRRKRVAITP